MHQKDNDLSLTVIAHREADYVCLQVSDTGFGIAPEDLDRIFSLEATRTSPGALTRFSVSLDK
jgi:signal transduction histidine kinase